MVLVMNVAIRVALFRDIWQRVVSSVVVNRLGAAANVTAKGELVSALGEGIADGLDVAGL
jgi:TRAP-type mannitol/chloroaromatic compound transport system substrate-binding protein